GSPMFVIQYLRVILSARKPALAMLALVSVSPTARGQVVKAQQVTTAGARASAATTAMASPAGTPPVIDGRDDDAVWHSAAPITGFRVFDPKEDGDPSFQTEARIVYDAENLYVFVRMFDTHPDSIVSLLS